MGRASTPEAGPVARAVSAEIRSIMGAKRISGLELARLSGISQNYIAKRLRDDYPFNLNDMDRISHALGISVAVLIQRAMERAAQKADKNAFRSRSQQDENTSQ